VLEEEREKDKHKFVAHYDIVKIWFEKHKDSDNNFEVGDLGLISDRVNEPKGKHTRFQNLWLGPYQIIEKIGAGTYRLQGMEVNLILFLSLARS